jgi:hypothetical protein
MAEQQPFKDSDLYEYTLHDETDNTLQVFTAHTMDSTYFSAKQTLDLLNFLAANREQIEALANLLQAKRERPKTVEERIDNLFTQGE